MSDLPRAGAAPPRPRRSRGYRWALLAFFAALSLLLHANSFSVPHREGDEMVYLALAEEMGWDFSHYTTRDNRTVNYFPGATYTNPLFHQPPLFPYVLKIGRALGDPVVAGLLLQSLAGILLLYLLLRFARFFRLPDAAMLLLLALATTCPLLLFSTTRLHLDGLFAVFFFGGVTLLAEAEASGSRRLAAAAAALLVLAFNTRFTALALAPLVLLVPLLGWRAAGDTAAVPGAGRRRWERAAIVGVPLVLLGGFHYGRLLLEYHTLAPGTIMGVGREPFAHLTPLREALDSRTRPRVLAYLAFALPVMGVALLPPFWRLALDSWRRRGWEILYLGAFLYALAINFVADYSFRQLRYYGAMTPFLYATTALLFARAGAGWRRALALLAVLSLLLMATTAFLNTVVSPENALLHPSLVFLLPSLRAFYR